MGVTQAACARAGCGCDLHRRLPVDLARMLALCPPHASLESGMYFDVVAIRVLEPYRLRLLFEDGTTGVIDVADRVAFRGVFAPLTEPPPAPTPAPARAPRAAAGSISGARARSSRILDRDQRPGSSSSRQAHLQASGQWSAKHSRLMHEDLRGHATSRDRTSPDPQSALPCCGRVRRPCRP